MSPLSESIVLIGMMGAGKSSVGRDLQKRTGHQHFDTDELIEAKAGMSIPEIFAQNGEEWFRDLETTVLEELPRDVSAIVVSGGGAVLRPENSEMLKGLGTVVWLDAEAGTLLERASRQRIRPLLETRDPQATLSEIFDKRRPLYAKIADLRVDTTHLRHHQVADIILSELRKRFGPAT